MFWLEYFCNAVPLFLFLVAEKSNNRCILFSKLKLHFYIILSFFSAKYLKYVTERKPYMQSNEQQRLLQQFYDDLDDDTFI